MPINQSRSTRVIVALDTPSLEQAEQIVRETAQVISYFKIGSQLFTAAGPQAIEMVQRHRADVFLDLKFHDIPHTVAEAALSAVRWGVNMFNVHACGGPLMLKNTVEAIGEFCSRQGKNRPVLLGVTVLTSMDRQQLNAIGVARSVKNQVLYLAKLCRDCGLNGVVCSGQEIALLRRVIGEDFTLVVPGIRPADTADDDQKRIVTPGRAAKLGADYIVVGRPIVAAADRAAAATQIVRELSSAAEKNHNEPRRR